MKELITLNGKRLVKESFKCDCSCHHPESAIMHFMACCDNGYKISYTEVDEDNNIIPQKPLLDGFKIMVPKEYQNYGAPIKTTYKHTGGKS